MKLIGCLLSVMLVLVKPPPTLQKDGQSQKNETKGDCSSIAPNNSGNITITCSGFSDRQNQQIISFLKQLSSQQGKDQDIVLRRLDEIMSALKSAQLAATPRVISEEMQRYMLSDNWAICAPQSVRIIAPRGNTEAGELAIQLRGFLRRVGQDAQVDYQDVRRERDDQTDLKFVLNQTDNCVSQYLNIRLSSTFKIRFEQGAPYDVSQSRHAPNPAHPVIIYVYPR